MRRARLVVGAIGIAMVTAALIWAGTGIHDFGAGESLYGRIVAHSAVPDRSATNSVVVTAFDYRGFDTLGEEFILFISVVGVTILLRSLRGEEQDGDQAVRPGPGGSESSRWLGAALVGPMIVLG